MQNQSNISKRFVQIGKLTIILLEPKVIKLCHRPAYSSLQSDQALHCLLLIFISRTVSKMEGGLFHLRNSAGLRLKEIDIVLDYLRSESIGGNKFWLPKQHHGNLMKPREKL